MTKPRNDSWTEEQDLLLAEKILAYIREGKTQVAAFEVVGEELGRTAAACAYRWNTVVRTRFEKSITLAKKQRLSSKKINRTKKTTGETSKIVRTKNNNITPQSEPVTNPETEVTLTKEMVLTYLEKHLHTEPFNADYVKNLEKGNTELTNKNEELNKRIEKQDDEINHLQKQLKEYEDDLREALKIINQAASMSGRFNDRKAFLADNYEEDIRIAQ